MNQGSIDTTQKNKHALYNKIILVTGAASGIGHALAVELDKLGVQLVLNDINSEALQSVAEKLTNSPLCLPFSVADKSAWIQCKADIHEHFNALDKLSKTTEQTSQGDAFVGIDGIINNAGIAHDTIPFEDISEDDFKKVMDINFYGVLWGSQTFLPELKLKPQAWVVNISSIFGITSIAQLGAYCASKFAVRGLTESLRMEALANFPNVTVTTIHPGGIKTPIANNAIAVDDRLQDTREQEFQQFNKQLMTSAPKAARTIIAGMTHHKAKVLIGPDAKLMDFLARLFPVKYSKIVLSQLKKRGLLHD